MSRFANCLAITLRHEGGWSDHPRDPGGATMRGVTIARFAAYKGYAADKDDFDRLPLPRKQAIRNELSRISNVDLEDIYRRGYWNLVKADDLPAGLDLTMFDFAVNSGPGKAVRTLQGILGVKPDGVMGMMTVAAVRKYDTLSLIRRMYEARMKFLRNLGTWPTFGKGWKRRVDDILDRSLSMAKGKPTSAPVVSEPTPKANPADTRTLAKPNAQPKVVMAGSAVGSAVTEAAQMLAPHAEALSVIKWLCIALAVVSAGLLLWRAFKEQPS